MLAPRYTRVFEKDLRRMMKRGKDVAKIKNVIRDLIHETPLDPRLRDHKLLGLYRDRRDCHVEPDWVLIYKKSAIEIVFERTGTHADLFH